MSDQDKNDDNEEQHDNTPGGYDSIEGIKKRAEALENEIIPKLIDRAENRIKEEEGRYTISAPDADPNDVEMLFHFGILAGAALEREYPGENRQQQQEVEDALFETLAAIVDLQERLIGGAQRSNVSTEEVFDSIFEHYQLEEAENTLEEIEYTRDEHARPADLAISERSTKEDTEE